jgi:hypothetical protein
MSDIDNDRWENAIAYSIPTSQELEQVAKVLCERALNDAKSQLHPLLQNIEFDRLDQRPEFLKAFKSALEQIIVQKMATWCPSIQAIFRFDVTPTENIEDWDGAIHLLVKVPQLTKEVEAIGKNLDGNLVRCLKKLNWQRLEECQSILDVHQVTANELAHGIGYGAMFHAVYIVPVKIWPLDS